MKGKGGALRPWIVYEDIILIAMSAKDDQNRSANIR